MSSKQATERYGHVAASLHWVSAAAVLLMLVLGFAAAASPAPTKVLLLRVHVPLGALVVALTLARVVWWFFDARPAPLPRQPVWQARLAQLVHALLYAVLLVLGASGIGLIILSGAGDVLFAGAPGPLPVFTEFTPMLTHMAAVIALLGLLALHVAAALYHQVLPARRPVGPYAAWCGVPGGRTG